MYCHGNPVRYKDPTGHEVVTATAIVVGGSAAVAAAAPVIKKAYDDNKEAIKQTVNKTIKNVKSNYNKLKKNLGIVENAIKASTMMSVAPAINAGSIDKNKSVPRIGTKPKEKLVLQAKGGKSREGDATAGKSIEELKESGLSANQIKTVLKFRNQANKQKRGNKNRKPPKKKKTKDNIVLNKNNDKTKKVK